MGDNITPPQQAFNWIADVYSTTEEIKANGQTIVGLLHEDIGHLGIFVSGQVAKKEHAQIVEVLKYIQQLPPGLYGMHIEEHHDRHGEVTYEVTLRERKVEDLRTLRQERPRRREAVPGGRRAVRAVRARVLAAGAAVRPRDDAGVVRQGAARLPSAARAVLGAVGQEPDAVAAARTSPAIAKANRRPRAARQRQRADRDAARPSSSAWLDLYRDLRDAASEAAFFEVYGNMLSLQMADEREEIRRKGKFDPRSIPAVREVLDTLEEGSAIEGLARIAMLISKAGRGHRRLSQMQKTREILSPEGEIAHLSEDERRRLLQEETIVVEFEPERAQAIAAEAAAHGGRPPARARAARLDRGAARPRGRPAQARVRTARAAADERRAQRAARRRSGAQAYAEARGQARRRNAGARAR